MITAQSGQTAFITPSVWHHVAGVFDGSHALLYVDGVVVQSVAYSGGIAPEPPSSFLSIGSENGRTVNCPGCGPNTRNYHGLIDEARVWNRALSQAEIQAIYAARNVGLCKIFSTRP